jgi:signal transduction histidine kinase
MEVSKVIVTKWFAKCPEILYPTEHLKSIFQNLLMNSIKYSSPDRLLEIEVKSYEKDYRTILEFRDNGIGFDSNISGMEVLEPFKQLDTNKEGSGLGLYIIKTIVEHHHGYIHIQSQPDKGAIFTIALN